MAATPVAIRPPTARGRTWHCASTAGASVVARTRCRQRTHQAQRHRRSSVADRRYGRVGRRRQPPQGNCARPRGAVLQAVTPVAVRVADAKDASHGDRCHLNGRPHRVDAAAGVLHQRSGALGASFRPGSDAGGPSSPWRQHARVTRRRPPSRRQRPPARAAYRLQTQRRQWVALQADDAHTCAACADRRHSYSTARSLMRCGASTGPESAGLWRRATAAPLHAARRRPTATTSLATPAARALLLHRMQQHQWRPTLPTAPAAKAATSAGTRAGPSGALGACSDRSGPGPACARQVPTAAGPTAARAR